MSDDGQQSLSIQLLGAGCASLSLAARAAELPRHDLTIIDPGTHSYRTPMMQLKSVGSIGA